MAAKRNEWLRRPAAAPARRNVSRSRSRPRGGSPRNSFFAILRQAAAGTDCRGPRQLLFASALFLTGCSALQKQADPSEVFHKRDWQNRPSWATRAPAANWWRAFNSPMLNRDIEAALAHNPGLAVLAARVDKAAALTRQAQAARYPVINAGAGLRTGRSREVDFGPYDLKPFTARGQLSWEIDLTGKLAAARRSAEESRQAAFWDLDAARLALATELAETYFTLARLSDELAPQRRIVSTHHGTVYNLNTQLQAGLVPAARVEAAKAELARAERDVLDIQRLMQLAQLKRATLRGDTTSSPYGPGGLTDTVPDYYRSTSDVLRQRPDLLAAEARVRAAFQLEESARLNLLPSITLGAGAMGATSSPTNRFRVWEAQVGPSLDIPIFDPTRLAQVKVRRAETREASAHYRATVLKAFEEVEGAYLNLRIRKRQLAEMTREVTARERALADARAQREAGVASDLEVYEAQRLLHQTQRAQAALRHQHLSAHLDLVKALGGGPAL